MRNLRKVICGVMAVVSMATGMMSVSADETKWETHYVSAQSGLNCRIKPSTEDSEIIKIFPKGTELQVIGVDETGKWYEVWDGETQGYCYGTYFVDNKEDLDKQEIATDSNGKTKGKYLGRFKITHYCPCYTCNGSNSGRTAWAGQIIPGQTIAVDPSVIGKLQWVYIDGYGYRRAEDCGAFGGNHIDVAVPTHSMALDMGVVYKDVYLAE